MLINKLAKQIEEKSEKLKSLEIDISNHVLTFFERN